MRWRCWTMFAPRCARRLRRLRQPRRIARAPLARQVQNAGSTRLIVRPIAPFRLDLTVWALRRRRRNAVDRWDGVTYRRVIVVGARPTELAILQTGSPKTPRLVVTASPSLRTQV